MITRLRTLVAALALVFLVAHLHALPQTLEDIDSVNFALGVERFDVANHRPHPPGYPVFIALAKASTSAIGVILPGWDRDRRAAAGLAIWGVIAGALASWVLTEFWIAAGLSSLAAFLAALLTMTSPIFWLTASRPLTDVPGLVAAVLVQMLLIRALTGPSHPPSLPSGATAGQAPGTLAPWHPALVGAFGLGFAIGLRSQTLWLAGPLFVWVLVDVVRRLRVMDAVRLVGAAAVGALLWAVPLFAKTGGFGGYMRAVQSQGAEDLTGVELLATRPSWDLFTISIRRTFIDLWDHQTLAHVVLLMAIAGLVIAVRRHRRLLAILSVAFLPYLFFHLAFQETVTIRYGLPMVIPVVGLAVVALAAIGPKVAAAGVAGLAIASLLFAEPCLVVYASTGAPVFRVFQDMQTARPAASTEPLLKMHHQVWWGIRRAVEWYRPVWDVGSQPFPGDREWLGVVDHFKSGSQRPVWFLAHLSRTDLAVFDHRTTALAGRYEFPSGLRTLIGGTSRLDSLSWWTVDAPGWMLERGWSLTPELAGMTIQDHLGPHVKPAVAYLARRSGAARIMIGGRYLGAPDGPPATVQAVLDGKLVGEWRTTGNPRWFVQWFDLPEGIAPGVGAFATLEVRALPATPGAQVPPVGLEQFDVATGDEFIYAFGNDWYEFEENPQTGRSWRWTSAKSTIDVRGPDGNRTLMISGESPLKNFDSAPEVKVRLGDRVVATFKPDADFAETVALPADAVKAASGLVTIETSKTWKPGDRGVSGDQRELGLRLYEVKIR